MKANKFEDTSLKKKNVFTPNSEKNSGQAFNEKLFEKKLLQ